MKCGWVENLIPEYFEGILDQYQLDLVTQHLENCEDCKLELDAIDRLLDLVDNVGIEYPSAMKWNGFWGDLRRKIALVQVDQRPSFLNLGRYHFNIGKFAGIGCMLLLVVLLCLQLFGNVSFLMYPYRDTEDFRAVNQFFGEIPIVQILEQINFEEQEVGFVWESDLVANLEFVELHDFFPDAVAESWYLTDLTELDFLVYPSGNLDDVVLTSMK